MSVTPEFLAAIQKAGWRISAADETCAICRCGNPGCSLQIKLVPNKPIPTAWSDTEVLSWTKITDIQELRLALRSRREDLGLIIPEIEAEAGLADHHLGKIEKDYPTKIPNVQTLLWLMRALGLSMYIAPDEFPKPVLRAIAESRARLDYRRLRVRIFRGLRKLKG
jgi:transcriptional regulator with XRE-family HTH domain